jgi:hypothetical protein
MLCFDHNIGFWVKRQFFAENCRKSQKIVIITSTQVHQINFASTHDKDTANLSLGFNWASATIS